ncbi:hypothetical protein M7I_6788 [Glarea lozoyensis 74030]|uniref:Myb-like domain-containing protein n=1 Tax=Glarea lozoyensis (strain ATCC 74030 / MF5533) TaxID=1104152 RepID=H0EVJ0_GLAL7|nr:hypothetical protein M7I_6788 [Glarea lozoyensis 74030]
MVKDFLVNDRESQTMRDLQFFLNRWFPEAFVTSFGAFSKFGSSTLLDESFDLALNVRTQYAISELLYAKESDEWDPELIVSEVFYDNETQTPKNIMGNDTPNSPDQTNFINERVESIRSAFNGPKGQDQGDLVDFDNLQDELFPWPAFLTDLVSWTRQRADEIISCVRAQGGPDVIQENLSTMMPAHDTQDNIEQAGFANEEPQDPAPVDITGDMPSKRVMVDAPRGSVNSPELGSSKRRQIPQSVVEDLNLGDMEDDEDLPPLAEAMAKSAMAKQVTGEWNSYQQEINKENRPVQNNNVIPPVYKKKFNDKNHQGQKVGWETQELESTAPRGNASKQNQEESEPSEDEGFQSDRAAHEPERRVVQLRKTIGKSRARGSSPEEVIASASNNVRPAVQVGQSRRAAKAQTVNEDDEEDDSSRNSVRRQGNVKASRPAARPQTVDEDEDDEEDVPPPTVVEVQDLARMATSQSKRPRVQTRTPWSEHDEQHLIDLIAKHGTSWSLLYKLSHFDRETTDVGLKDKARNLRAAWEK